MILITGASGFVGTNFINRGHQNSLQVDLLTQDLSDINFNSVEIVLHLSAIVHQTKSISNNEYYKANRDLAFDVARSAKEKGVKHFIFMSTVKVYGESTHDNVPLNEFSVCKPSDTYGKSKHEAEKLIRGLEDEKFRVAVIRSPLVYGPRVKGSMYNLIRLVDKSTLLPFGGLNNKRSFVYVGNLIALIDKVISGRASGTFIAGDKYAVSTTRLTELIAKGFGKRLYLFKIPERVIKVMRTLNINTIERLFGSYEFNNDYTNQTLSFSPPYFIEEGIFETISWYKQSLQM